MADIKLPEECELDTQLERDEETLSALGGELTINGVKFPPPTTAVLSLLELIHSPFLPSENVDGNLENVRLQQIHETLYVLKYREEAVSDLFDLVRYEKMAEKSSEFFKAYIKQLNYAGFSKKVYMFAESLGVFSHVEVIYDLVNYITVIFKGLGMLPNNKEEENKKKREEILTQNGLQQ